MPSILCRELQRRKLSRVTPHLVISRSKKGIKSATPVTPKPSEASEDNKEMKSKDGNKEESLWLHQKIKKKVVDAANHSSEVAEFIDRLYGLFVWKDPRKTVWIVILCVVASVAVPLVPVRILFAGAIFGLFGDYLLGGKYKKDEKFLKHALDPTWHLGALGSKKPHYLTDEWGAVPKFRKKTYNNDFLKDFIRRAPLTDDHKPTEINIPHEWKDFRV
mmetsp:Transcript_6833/g.9652  ORF Transcript_6833/g.9652 Transcript_6833/m.9652 type:complete len:218 (-) Transcript_6833:252-905(-)